MTRGALNAKAPLRTRTWNALNAKAPSTNGGVKGFQRQTAQKGPKRVPKGPPEGPKKTPKSWPQKGPHEDRQEPRATLNNTKAPSRQQ